MIKFVEIVRLVKGKSFGELALIKSANRAARIVCVEDCKFAVMNKEQYQNILRKIDEQNMENIIKFLRQLPFLAHWSKNVLGKLSYAIEKVPCIRGQKIVKEGDPADYVYIIERGEFEITKYLGKDEEEQKKKAEEDELIRPLLAHEDAKRCQAIKLTKEWHNPSRIHK